MSVPVAVRPSDPLPDEPRGGLRAAILAVAGFQLRRLLTPPRLAMAALGAVFPAAVMLAAARASRNQLDRDLAAVLLYVLIPEGLCMLGLLVTMCPTVADELERGTWVHVTVRPGGRKALLLGTYLAAVAWTGVVAMVAIGLALAVTKVWHPEAVAATLVGLVLLSCIGRAALFALPAVIMPKRALVASVGVAIVVEYLAGVLPAVVNQATVSLRLRSLLVEWMGWRRKLPIEIQLLVDLQPAWVHVVAVFVLTAILLTAAIVILERRQFPPSEEV
jgi:ABC-type transport system involved in multi-copper enzyme maturation permease subunit